MNRLYLFYIIIIDIANIKNNVVATARDYLCIIGNRAYPVTFFSAIENNFIIHWQFGE